MPNVASTLIISGFAAGLAIVPLALDAQTETQSQELGNASPSDGDGIVLPRNEATALEAAVYNELREIGIHVPGLDKLSSAQLAGILLTVTREDPVERNAALNAIIANGDYDVPDLSERTLDDMGDIRDVVEESLARAGWSADVSFLDDGQVIALFTEIAERGNLTTERIEALTNAES